jgi:hypothetical protein
MGFLDFLESCCDAYENGPPSALADALKKQLEVDRQAIRMRNAMTRDEQLAYYKAMRDAKDK